MTNRATGARYVAGTSAAAAMLLLAACSGLPNRIDSLEQAREAVRNAEQDRLASEQAATELAAARAALAEADEIYEDKGDLELIEHHAYLAHRYADIAMERIEAGHARAAVEQAEADRNRVLLRAREREVERAEQDAIVAQQRARNAEQNALSAEQQALSAQQRAQATAEQAAAVARQNAALVAALSELQARETERGLVLTLSDVLFDTARAELKPGAGLALDRLAEFMKEYPERNVRIEGHTDARGTDEYNRDLSERRARAVESALLARGISPGRVITIGLGEGYPVASNATAEGMQENRRVEIVISDDGGQFGRAAMDRRAALNQ